MGENVVNNGSNNQDTLVRNSDNIVKEELKKFNDKMAELTKSLKLLSDPNLLKANMLKDNNVLKGNNMLKGNNTFQGINLLKDAKLLGKIQPKAK